MHTKSTFRKHFLIFLRHASKKDLTPTEIQNRLIQTFNCQSIIVVKRNDLQGLNFDYIIGVKCTDASKNTVERTIRALFFEFEGKLCQIQFRKGWGPICLYLSTENIVLIHGCFSEESIQNVAKATQLKKRIDSETGERRKKKKRVYSIPIL